MTLTTRQGELRLRGSPVCRGVAIGKPFFFTSCFQNIVAVGLNTSSDVIEEIQRYRRAVSLCKADIERLKTRMHKEAIDEGAAILETHLLILCDPLFVDDVERVINERRCNAEAAFNEVISAYQQQVDALVDPFFKERFNDIREVVRRLFSYLRHTVRLSFAELPEGTVVFVQELSAYEAAEADSSRVCAFVTEGGGATSHAAIIARAKGIPYVAKVSMKEVVCTADEVVIVDGRTGEIIVAPQADTLAVYCHVQKQITDHLELLSEMVKAPPETTDGLAIRLMGNVEAVEEVLLLHQNGGAGVGLLRSEHLFLANTVVPGEEEQYRHYREFVRRVKGLPMAIRTFDLGGDKSTFCSHEDKSQAFFVGNRGLYLLLQERTILRNQLRAIMRAAAGGNVSVLFPMVSSVSDLREAKKLLAEVAHELAEETGTVPRALPVGCMIEVPAAALIADLLAKECDFFSIGTNDLTHYSLAIERSYQSALSMRSLCHPSVFRMVKGIVDEAQLQGIPVSVCGEVASDPRFTPLLLGLGVKEFSVACRYIPLIKNIICRTSASAAKDMADIALSFKTSTEIQEYLTEHYKRTVPDDCFYNY